MKYFNDRWLKIIFITLPLLLIITIIVYFFNCNKSIKNDNNISFRNNSAEYYDNFKVDKVSIVRRKDGKMLFSMSAKMIVHRKRISRLFIYHNLKEILISGVRIDFYPYNNGFEKNQKPIALPFIDIFNSVTSFGKPSTPTEDYIMGNVDDNFDLLSRLLFEDLSINIYLTNNKKISICTKFARINSDFKNIVLEGLVKVIDSDGNELHASDVVWSKKFNGIYLPGRYMLNNKQYKGKAFYAMDTKGKFSKVLKTPNIEYADFIKEREKILYAYLSKNMPPYLKFIFGMSEY
jgi:hypothetical protein